MNEEMRGLFTDMVKQLMKIFVIAILSMAIVSVAALTSIAYQNTKIAQEYFNYEYLPTNITQTNNN